MLTVMAGPDIRDWYAGPELNIDYRNGLSDGVRGLPSPTAVRSDTPSQLRTSSV